MKPGFYSNDKECNSGSWVERWDPCLVICILETSGHNVLRWFCGRTGGTKPVLLCRCFSQPLCPECLAKPSGSLRKFRLEKWILKNYFKELNLSRVLSISAENKAAKLIQPTHLIFQV